MNHTDEQQFADAVRHRATITDLPDFAAVEVAARRRGGRMRVRRQGGVAVASLAVAAIAGGGVWLAGSQQGGPSGAGNDVGFAGGPTSAVSDVPPTPPTPTPSTSLQAIESGAPGRSPAGKLDLSTAYAVLDAPGWVADDANIVADEKLWYVNGDRGITLSWRPAATSGPKYTQGRVVATTTIDGDPAKVFADGTVVGPVRDGRFLTLAGTLDLTTADLVELATQVHRQ